MCLVLFLPVQSLITCFRSSLTRFADFCRSLLSLITRSSSDSKASLRFIAFSGFPTAVHRAFLCFDAKAWPQSQTDLFTCTTVLHCGHTFLRRIRRSNLRYCTVDIPFWTSCKRSHKRLHASSTEKPRYHVLQLTWSHIYRYVCVTERYTKTLHMKKMGTFT